MGYSVDLRERIVEAVLERSFSMREAADTSRVGHATVERYLRQFRERGELTPCRPQVVRAEWRVSNSTRITS